LTEKKITSFQEYEKKGIALMVIEEGKERELSTGKLRV